MDNAYKKYIQLMANKPKQFIYQGNIDLSTRPQVKNSDGTISTVRSMYYDIGDNNNKEFIVIPTVSNEGTIMQPEEAINYWNKRKQYLGRYKKEKEAQEASQKIHEQQAQYYRTY